MKRDQFGNDVITMVTPQGEIITIKKPIPKEWAVNDARFEISLMERQMRSLGKSDNFSRIRSKFY